MSFPVRSLVRRHAITAALGYDMRRIAARGSAPAALARLRADRSIFRGACPRKIRSDFIRREAMRPWGKTDLTALSGQVRHGHPHMTGLKTGMTLLNPGTHKPPPRMRRRPAQKGYRKWRLENGSQHLLCYEHNTSAWISQTDNKEMTAARRTDAHGRHDGRQNGHGFAAAGGERRRKKSGAAAHLYGKIPRVYPYIAGKSPRVFFKGSLLCPPPFRPRRRHGRRV